jgi:hypothetical protein
MSWEGSGVVIENQTTIPYPVNVLGGGSVIEHDHHVNNVFAA